MNTKEFIDKYFVERTNTNSLKWDALDIRYGEKDLLPLWVADMEFKMPSEVIEELKKRIEHGVFGYSYLSDSYYNSFKKWMYDNFNCIIEKDWIRTTTGVVQALYSLINCFTNENDNVMIMPPVYYPFFNCIKDTGRKEVLVNLKNDNNKFSIDFDKVEYEMKNRRISALIFCSPHNPVSRVWTEKELDKLYFLCDKYDVLIISDEIHQDFTFGDNRHIPGILVSDGKYLDRTIVVNAASKTFNLASFTHSNIIIKSEKLRDKYDKYCNKYLQTEINVLGAYATEISYNIGKEWLQNLKEVIYSNYNYIKEALKKANSKIEIIDLQGTYLPILDLSKILNVGMNDKKIPLNRMEVPESVYNFIQKKCKLAVDYGCWFGKDYGAYIRLNLATHPKNIEEAINRIIEEEKKL